MRLIKDKTSINFLGKTRRRIALAISVLLIVVSLASLATRGLEFGIDFTGGILLEVEYPQAADLDLIRGDLATAGYDGAQVQLFGAENVVLVRLPPQEGAVEAIREQLQQVLHANDADTELRRVESVSPQVGSELAEQGALAMIFALLMIFVYVMIRFQWKFSAGAVAALAHDAIVRLVSFPYSAFPSI